MKHTPGPWGYFNCITDYPIFEASTGCFDHKGKGYDAGKGYAANVLATVLNEEDANIIAAAPDMLKLLKGTLRYLRASGNRAKGLQRDISALLDKIGEDDLD